MWMAMQSGNAVVGEKMHGGGGGGEQGRGQQWWHNHQHSGGQQHFVQMDERDGFISWLRGEFAAANAIIDALCHHLRVVGEPGEYDGVIGCVQQRRCNWNPVLHMQQYFSVNEVVYALQQVEWRRSQQQQQRGFFEGSGKLGKEYRRGGSGRGGQRWDGFREGKEGHQGQNLSNLEGAVVNSKELNGNENLENGVGRVGNGNVEEKKGEK